MWSLTEEGTWMRGTWENNTPRLQTFTLLSPSWCSTFVELTGIQISRSPFIKTMQFCLPEPRAGLQHTEKELEGQAVDTHRLANMLLLFFFS